MPNYPFDMQLVVDPNNPQNVVQDGDVTLYATTDTGATSPLALTDPFGLPLPNPLRSNAYGFLAPFVATVPQVMWKSGSFTGYFNSYIGMRDEAIAARDAAEDSAASAAASAALAQAPTDEQVDEGIARANLPATYATIIHSHAAADITDSTTVGRNVLKAADAAAARTAIGAGTSSLAIGATSTTAKAGNYVPAMTEVTGVASQAQIPFLNIPRFAPYLKREEKISKWMAALANAGTTKANLIVAGDSISEGTGSTNTINRWQNQLQTALRYRHGISYGADYPFIPCWPKTTAPGMPVTRTGNVVADTSRGLGWKAVTIGTDGVVTFTFTGTSCKLMYFKGSTSGQMTVQIDGGAVTTIDTNSVSNPVAANAAIWDSGALTPGAHTVVVAKAAASSNSVYPAGLLTFNGDETTGIRVLDAAYHGVQSTWFTSARMDHMVSAVSAIGNVKCIVLNVGTNDMGFGNSLATYKTNIELFVSKLRTGGYTDTIVLQNCYKGSGRDEATWAGYGEQLRQIAATDADIAYFDWRLRMPDIPNPYNTAPDGYLFNDGLHPNDTGYGYIGRFLANYLSDRA